MHPPPPLPPPLTTKLNIAHTLQNYSQIIQQLGEEVAFVKMSQFVTPLGWSKFTVITVA